MNSPSAIKHAASIIQSRSLRVVGLEDFEKQRPVTGENREKLLEYQGTDAKLILMLEMLPWPTIPHHYFWFPDGRSRIFSAKDGGSMDPLEGGWDARQGGVL